MTLKFFIWAVFAFLTFNVFLFATRLGLYLSDMFHNPQLDTAIVLGLLVAAALYMEGCVKVYWIVVEYFSKK